MAYFGQKRLLTVASAVAAVFLFFNILGAAAESISYFYNASLSKTTIAPGETYSVLVTTPQGNGVGNLSISVNVAGMGNAETYQLRTDSSGAAALPALQTPGSYVVSVSMPSHDQAINLTVSGTSTVPGLPIGLTSTCSTDGNQVTLSWSSASGATSYLLRVDDPSNNSTAGAVDGWYVAGSGDLMTEIAALSYTYRSIPSKTYNWWVHGKNSLGFGSAASASFNCAGVPAGDVTPPSVPQSVFVTAGSTSQLNLSWSASTDNVAVTGYKVYRGGSLIATTPSTTYTDTGLAAGVSYTYTVAAYDAAGNVSGQTSAVSGTTNSIPTVSATLAVTSPKAGDKWYKYTSYDVTWTAPSSVAKVNIRLLINGIEYRRVAQDPVANTGSFSWTPAADLDLYSRDDYVIRVSDASNAAVYADSGLFSIANALPVVPPSITITVPVGGEQFTAGQPMTITWQNNNYRNSLVNLYLYRGSYSGDYNYVAQNGNLAQPNDGTETWTIPASTQPGNNYFVRINLDVKDPEIGYDANFDTRLPFSIVSGTSGNTAPKITGGSVPANIQAGQTVSFSWTATDANNDDLSWSVDWGDVGGAGGCSVNPPPGTGRNWNYTASHAWANAGTYTMKVTVYDCRGGSDSTSSNIVVGSASAVGTLVGRIKTDTGNFISEPADTPSRQRCFTQDELPGAGFLVHAQALGNNPLSLTARADLCNPDPYYSLNLPAGDYEIWLETPFTWQVIGTNRHTVTIQSGQYNHQWFQVSPKSDTSIPGTIQGRIQTDSGRFIFDPIANPATCVGSVSSSGFLINYATAGYGDNLISGQARADKCNSEGGYYSINLPPGVYSLWITTPNTWQVIGADRMQITVQSGQFVDQWFHVSPKSDIDLPPPVGSQVSIVARGTYAAGSYPIMQLWEGGTTLAEWTVTGSDEIYKFNRTAPFNQNLRVKFINDYYNRATGEDRNLTVDYISVYTSSSTPQGGGGSGVVYQTEDPGVFASGVYVAGRGCTSGYGLGETLHCNGYFEYPTAGGNPPPPTTSARLDVVRIPVQAQNNLPPGSTAYLGQWVLNAANSTEDVRVTSISFRASTTGKINSLTLMNYLQGDTVIAPVNDNPVVSNNRNATSTFVLTQPLVIRRGDRAIVKLTGRVGSNANAGEVDAWGLTDTTVNPNSSVVASGSTGRANVYLTPYDGDPITIGSDSSHLGGTLNINLDSFTPSSRLVVFGATGVDLAEVRLKAAGEAIDLTRLVVNVADGGLSGTASGDYTQVTKFYLKKDGVIVGSQYGYTPSGAATQINLNRGDLTVPQGTTGVKLSILADLVNIGTNQPGRPNADIKAGLGGPNAISATGNGSNSTAIAKQYLDSTGSAIILHKSAPSVILETPTNRLGAVSVLHRTKISAIGNTVGIYKMSYVMIVSGGVNVSNVYTKLVSCNGCGGIQDGSQLSALTYPVSVRNLGNTAQSGAEYQWSVLVSDSQSHGKRYLPISAGGTATIDLYGNMALTSGIDTVSTSLLGDARGKEAAADALYGGRFSWTDLNVDDSNASTALVARQWYNGYYVAGLGPTATTTPITVGE